MATRMAVGLAFLGSLVAGLVPSVALAAAPEATLSTHSLAFSSQPWLQRSTPLTITLTNTGDATLVVQNVDFAG
jgi:hypothetical protein